MGRCDTFIGKDNVLPRKNKESNPEQEKRRQNSARSIAVHTAHFESVYELLWHYCVVLRLVSRHDNGGAARDKNGEEFKRTFFGQLLATLIQVFERKEKMGGASSKHKRENMVLAWQHAAGKSKLTAEFAAAHHNGDKTLAAQEVEVIYQQAVGDMYTLLREGKVMEILESIVKVSRGCVQDNSSEDNSSSVSSGIIADHANLKGSNMRKLKHKVNFMIGMYINYEHEEKEISRKKLKKDIVKTWKMPEAVVSRSKTGDDEIAL